MLVDKDDFIDWVKSEMQRQRLHRTEMARIGGISQGYVSHVLNREQPPGLSFCQAVAKALHMPEQDILHRAGLSQEHSITYEQPGMQAVIDAAGHVTSCAPLCPDPRGAHKQKTGLGRLEKRNVKETAYNGSVDSDLELLFLCQHCQSIRLVLLDSGGWLSLVAVVDCWPDQDSAIACPGSQSCTGSVPCHP